MRDELRALLQSAPDLCVVGEAGDCEAAQCLCRQLSPDVMLLNVRMHSLGGIEVARCLGELFPPIRTILVSTTDDSRDYALRASRAGTESYVVGNLGPAQFLTIIRHVVAGAVPHTMRVIVQLYHTGGGEKEQVVRATARHLTDRELEILQFIAEGRSNREIALALSLSAGTVKIHVEHILAKLGVADRTLAAVRGVERGLVR